MKKKYDYSKPRGEMFWQVGKETFVCQIIPQSCSICKATGTLVGLPKPLLKKQPDKTNVVCHPGLGGCNHGFHMDTESVKLYRQLL